MTSLAAFDRFCRGLPGSSFVVQWGGCHVHKVGPKLFAVGAGEAGFGGVGGFVFKATPLADQILREQGLAIRAPYLRRGTWVRVEAGAMRPAELFSYIAESYRLAVAAMTKAARRELGV